MARAPRVFAPGLLCYAIVRAIIRRNDCPRTCRSKPNDQAILERGGHGRRLTPGL
jgi:hypothetical protein